MIYFLILVIVVLSLIKDLIFVAYLIDQAAEFKYNKKRERRYLNAEKVNN